MYFPLVMCFVPILIAMLSGIESAEEGKMMYLVLLIFKEGLFASSHHFTYFSSSFTFFGSILNCV